VTSPSHAIDVADDGADTRTVTLSDGPVPADRDFVLEWTAAPAAAPQAAVFAEELAGSTYLLTMVTPPTAESAEAPLPRDLVFIIDTSGSMYGESMDQAKEALLLALDGLRPEDRFNIVRFSDTTTALFAKAMPVDERSLARGRSFVEGLVADGGTETLPALALALSRQPEPGRLRQVVFLTDGAVGNEQELFEQIAAQLGQNRVFTVGIGSAPNGYFMRKAAEVGRGTFTYIGKVSEVRERMTRLLAKLERPALTDLEVGFPGTLAGAPEVYPTPLPDLYRGEPVTFAAKLPGTPLDRLAGALTIAGRHAAVPWSTEVALGGLDSTDGIAAIWGRDKVTAIEDRAYAGADYETIRQEALRVALKHGLVTQYTSLVAVDAKVARPDAQQLASNQMPVNLPKGMDMEHIFGPAGTTQVQDQAPLPPGPELIEVRLDDAQLYALTGESVGMPVGATPATLKLLSGLAWILLGLTVLLVSRRTLRRRL
jgi:Ca-activated chloride channel family protein